MMLRSLYITSKVTEKVKLHRRSLSMLEYHGKELLRKYNVAVQEFEVLDCNSSMEQIRHIEFPEYVVKAQIMAGGRGQGVFIDGFKGGVHVTKNKSEVLTLAKKMIGNRLITKQTTESGTDVQYVMVARSINIKHEAYVSIVLDSQFNGPVMIVSPAGGMNIEAVAENASEKIRTVPLDLDKPIDSSLLLEIANFLGFYNSAADRCIKQIHGLYELFKSVDAVQIEINPLVETDTGEVIAVDAKLTFDDNAKYRQAQIFAVMETGNKTVTREEQAAQYNLNYVSLNGNIGCLVNGAGLAMATMDIIKFYGGDPANFLDVGGGVKEEYVIKAFEILTSDPKVKTILVNVFGGIVNCSTIATGIVTATKTLNLNVPLIVRLAGTNANEARKILKQSGLSILTASDLDEAAKTAIASVRW